MPSKLASDRATAPSSSSSDLACLFWFNVTFNNFSVISRWCLVATGSSMLTFIVLPHWSIMPQALDMIPHNHIILTLGRPVLALPHKSECQARCSQYYFQWLWYATVLDQTRDLPFPKADTLPTEPPWPVYSKECSDCSVIWSRSALFAPTYLTEYLEPKWNYCFQYTVNKSIIYMYPPFIFATFLTVKAA